MPDPPPVLASVWRGGVCEVEVRGHVAVVDTGGELTTSIGDPEHVVTLRSCVKPLQAQPFVRLAADELGAGDDEIAVVCASHQGEPVHVETVRRLLGRAGLDEDALRCGPQLPFDEAAARELLGQGSPPRRIHNNCSGKHAAMLATCVVQGWPVDDYLHADHPCQRAVTQDLAGFLGVDLDAAPWGIDGCGLPTYGVPLSALARGFAHGLADAGFRRCQDAMAKHPMLVAGTGRFDTALLGAAGAQLTAKIGGSALWAAVLRPSGPAVAIKLEAGLGEAIPPVAIGVLERLGAFPQDLPADLQGFVNPALTNWEGAPVGETRVEQGSLAAL